MELHRTHLADHWPTGVLRQQERFAGKRNVTCNARMGTRELKAFCALNESTLELLKMAMNELN